MQVQSRGAKVTSLTIKSSTSSESMHWDDDRAQQLFQQLCSLK